MDDSALTRTAGTGHAEKGAAVQSAIMISVGRLMTGTTSIYLLATLFVLPVGVVSTIITLQYLSPAQFGQLGLLMALASFMTVIYNIGILHGTFLWVYGTTGEFGDDALELTGQTDVAASRRALTTGLVISLTIAGAGTLLFFLFAKQVSSIFLGTPKDANLIAITAVSGGAGAVYRLTTNVFRFERRAYAYAAATIARPIGVLIGSTGLIVAGFGVWGAVLGTAVPTLICSAGNILATWRAYGPAVSWHDVRAIAIRTSWVMLPLIGLNMVHSGDVVLLSHFVHGAPIGVYRLASRLASPPSYFASAVLMAWSPLERSPTFLAAFQSRGGEVVRSFMLTYYIIVALAIVVIFSLFSHAFLVVAPASYAGAAKIVPLATVAYLVYGLYIVVLRTVRPAPLIFWYTVTALFAAAVFVGSGFVLVPAFGLYGPPAAVTLGMMAGTAGLVMLGPRSARARGEAPMAIQWRRIGAATLVSAAISAAGIAASGAGRVTGIVVPIVGLIVFFPALVLTGAIPRSHLALFKRIIPRRGERRNHMTLDDLPPAEREALAQFRNGGLRGARALDYARLTRALRRLAGFGTTAWVGDVRLGRYLASPSPESIRDWELRALIDEGADAYELSHLEVLAKQVRRRRFGNERKWLPRYPRGAVRARVRALAVADRTELGDALAAARSSNGSASSNGTRNQLEQVRALRAMRGSLGIGAPSASDHALATALWRDDGSELLPHQRDELRWLKAAAKLPRPSANGRASLAPEPTGVPGALVALPPER